MMGKSLSDDCGICGSHIKNPYGIFKRKKYCSLACYRDAVNKDRKINPVMETMYRDSLDDYPPNRRDA